MLFIGLLIAAALVYIVQMKLFAKYTFDALSYDVKLSAEEVFEGDDIMMYEELSNNKNLPVPTAKVDTALPDGLYFRLIDREGKTSGSVQKDVCKGAVESMFVLNGHRTIRRRWRIVCKKRGNYSVGSALIVANDLLGLNAVSKRIDAAVTPKNQVVVLPRAVELDEYFSSYYYGGGEKPASKSISTDPLNLCGAREYVPSDPMNRINWKSTAAHGVLMVNIEEHTRRNPFNIVMNMQSRTIEADPEKPSAPQYIEECITTTASLLDRAAGEGIAVRMFINTSPEYLGQESIGDDETGKNIVATRTYGDRRDIIDALRLLAAVEMKISVPFNKLLDHILEHHEIYSGGGNIIVVSPYIDERMVIFHDSLASIGVKVCFFVTTAYQNAMSIPPDVEVHYRVQSI